MAAVFVWQVLQVIGFSGGAALAITAQGIDDFDEVALRVHVEQNVVLQGMMEYG
jgi:hypothetical protein